MAQDVKNSPREGTGSPPPEGPNTGQAFAVAGGHFNAGRLAEAKAAYDDILRRDPASAAARHFLGLIAHAEGDHERGIELLRQAVAERESVAFFHGNLGEVYRSLGRNSEAAASCRRALEIQPVYPQALNTLGAALYEEGELDEAEGHLRRAIEFKPDFAEVHANLGNVLRATGRHEKAVKAFERALRHNPRLAGVRLVLGNALRSQGRMEDAVACYRQALDSDPSDAKLWSNLGVTLRSMERVDEALEAFRQAVRLQPNLAEIHMNLGTCLVVTGDLNAAVESYKTAFRLKRTPTLGRPAADRRKQWLADAADRRFLTTTVPKLKHDIDQFRYLAEKGRLPDKFGDGIGGYEEVLRELQSAPSDKHVVTMTSAQRERIADTYNKAVFMADAPALVQDPLNPDLDAEAIQSDYFADGPGVAWFDDFLVFEAIESLRRFCLESTIWFDFEYENGYLGAYLSDGFHCGLLFQIAEGLRQRFPRIFGERRLRQMWAYKYDSRLEGIKFHADAAAVNVNFWITPDEANLDPDTGGLMVFTREAPLEWDFERYNKDQEAIQEFLKESRGITIPHRRNRVVMFNSNLFHKTDAMRFAEGYENRRINITMLFGHRGDAPRMP